MKFLVCVVLATVVQALSLTSAYQTSGAPHYPRNMQHGMMRNHNTQAAGNYGNQNQGNNGMSMLPFMFGGDQMQKFAAMNMMMGPGQSNNMLPLAFMESENMLPLAMMSGQNNRGQYGATGSKNGAVNPMMWMAFDKMM